MTKFELVINAQTAMMLGLTVPPTPLAMGRRDDRVKRHEFITLVGGTAVAPYAAQGTG